MICAKHLVYSFEIGLLHEAREREARGWIGSGIYSMLLQSVYIRELKYRPIATITGKVSACNLCTCAS